MPMYHVVIAMKGEREFIIQTERDGDAGKQDAVEAAANQMKSMIRNTSRDFRDALVTELKSVEPD